MPSDDTGRRGIEKRVWASMREFTQRYEHPGDLRERLALGLGSGRIKALLLLRDGPLSLRELAAAHTVDAPYATVIVDRLEQLGYVERTLDQTDRRRKLVTLTAAGRDAAALAEELVSAPPSPLNALTPTELTTLDALLGRLLRMPPRKDQP